MIHSTIYDVAVRAGVSVATVSRTFAKPDIVTEATRKKVIEAANELDFAISRSATALKSKHTFRIAMLTGEAIATWFDSNLYKGLTEVLQTHGYDVSLYGIADTEQRMSFFDELPLRRNVDAVIVASFNVTMEEISNLQGMGVPLIGVNVPHNEGFNATVSIDNAKSMRMAINHLHALGHRRIAYICIDVSEAPMEYSADSRLQRFESACAAYEDIEQLTIALPPQRLHRGRGDRAHHRHGPAAHGPMLPERRGGAAPAVQAAQSRDRRAERHVPDRIRRQRLCGRVRADHHSSGSAGPGAQGSGKGAVAD